MPRVSPLPFTVSSAGHADRLGVRTIGFDREGGGLLERLTLRPELALFEPQIREAAARWSALKHPALTRVVEVARQARRVIVTTELPSGERLSDLLAARRPEEGAPGVDAALGLLLDLLPALTALHRAGLAHGLLSPARTVITTRGQLLLVDGIYASAVAGAGLNRHALTSGFGLRLPSPASRPALDAELDLSQAALSALAVAAGRAITDLDEPNLLGRLLLDLNEVAQIRAGDRFADDLRMLFGILLGLERGRRATADDAAREVRRLVQVIGEEAAQAALLDLARPSSAADEPVATPAARPAAAPMAAPAPVAVAAPAPEYIEVEINFDDDLFDAGLDAPTTLAASDTAASVRRDPPAAARQAAWIAAPAPDVPRIAMRDAAEPQPVPEWSAWEAVPAPETTTFDAPPPAVDAEVPGLEPLALEIADAQAHLPSERSAPSPVDTWSAAPALEEVASERDPEPQPAASVVEPEPWTARLRDDASQQRVDVRDPGPEVVAHTPAPTPSRDLDPEHGITPEAVPETSSLPQRLAVPQIEDPGSLPPWAHAVPAPAVTDAPPAGLSLREEIPAATVTAAAPPLAWQEPQRIDAPQLQDDPGALPPWAHAVPAAPPVPLAPPPVAQAALAPPAADPAGEASRHAMPESAWGSPVERPHALPPPVAPPPAFAPASFSPQPPPAPPFVPNAADPPVPPIGIRTEPIAASPVPAAPAMRLRAERPAAYVPRRTRGADGPSDAPPRTSPAGGAKTRRWAAAAAAMVLVVAGLASWPYLSGRAAEATPAESEQAAEPAWDEMPAAAKGTLVVDSQPAGAVVRLDGNEVGKTPLRLETVDPGPHLVTISTPTTSVQRSVQIHAGRTASIDVPVYSGWVAVFAPIPLDVSSRGKSLGTTDTPRIMLPPGRHVLTFSNRQFGYSATETVEILAGEERVLNLEPKASVNINAVPWAEVWVDGTKVGETPLANLAVSLGTREFVFRHPAYGARRMVTTITMKPAALSVDFTKPVGHP